MNLRKLNFMANLLLEILNISNSKFPACPATIACSSIESYDKRQWNLFLAQKSAFLVSCNCLWKRKKKHLNIIFMLSPILNGDPPSRSLLIISINVLIKIVYVGNWFYYLFVLVSISPREILKCCKTSTDYKNPIAK